MTERFLIRLIGGPIPGDREAQTDTWPLPDTIDMPEVFMGHYVKFAESDLPPQPAHSHVLRGAQYRWTSDDKTTS